MGCLLSCLGTMERDAGTKRKISTDNKSGRVLQNMRPNEDIQNNSDMYGYTQGWWDREGTNLRSRDHPIGTGIESSMMMPDRGIGVHMEDNSDMYGVGWRDGENRILKLGTVSDENQRPDKNNHNDMYGQGWVSEENQKADYNNHSNMHVQETLSEENQGADINKHNDMYGQGWVSEENQHVDNYNQDKMYGKGWWETCNG